ncbi:MAG: DUF1802 family protein [Gemmatimonadetes bacterium]|nr:DUF1802 family protein [Gemmatimonadota bacterium]
MRASSAVALKEWAVAEQALATGHTALLIRKGGIHEQQGGFGVEHREFWIFPTGWHQNPADLAGHLHPLLDALAPPPRGTVPFRLYAVVDDVFRVEHPDVLDRLDGMHPLAPPAAHARFAYRGRPFVHALVVRAYRLPQPVVLPDTLHYEGCVSWVQLDSPIPTAGVTPVLSDEDFTTLRGEIIRRLGTEGVVRV